jgi:hypothetical protein
MNLELIPVLAAVSSDSLINLVVWLVVAGLIYWLVIWLLGVCSLPEPFNKMAKIVAALVVFIICVNALLGLTGKSFW